MATTFAVPDGRVAMAATLWTGTGTSSARSVTGVGFQPDFVWGKARSVAYNHQLYDVVRGTGKLLNSNTTDAEQTNFTYGYLSSFDANGFSTTPGATDNENWNQTSATYVAWSWKAGGTAVSNTAGTITSSVSANTTAGFSVVTYTGTGATGTVGHGLGVAPSLIIVKARSSAAPWPVYSVTLGISQYLELSSTIAAGSISNYWGASSPTSTVFGLPNANFNNNISAATYVAYCWAPVAGYSAFGSYTGNGSADGPFIHTGFRPRFVVIKGSSLVSNWNIFDSSRSTYNANDTVLFADLSNAESSPATEPIDFLSNGIKIRNATNATNSSGNTYIYAAFAENPLKFSNAR